MHRLFLFWLLLLFSLTAPCAAGEEELLAVVVSHAQAGRALNPAELGLIYRRKQLVWADGTRINPANLPPDNPLRRAFSRRVLGSPPEGLTQYWNAMYFHGISPPHVLASEEAVLRFVAETPGAVGYVSACKTDARVKAVLWLLPDGEVSTQQPALKCSQD